MAGDPGLGLWGSYDKLDKDFFNPLVEQEFCSQVGNGQSLGICGARDAKGVRFSLYESDDRIICHLTDNQVEEIYQLLGKHLGKH